MANLGIAEPGRRLDGRGTVHILSSVLLVGTGFGSAFYLYFANRQPSREARAVVARLVVRADLWFTTPWLALALALFALAALCWFPVLWLQAEMARMLAAPGPVDATRYERLRRAWEWLGYPAFVAMLAIYALMVNKPSFTW